MVICKFERDNYFILKQESYIFVHFWRTSVKRLISVSEKLFEVCQGKYLYIFILNKKLKYVVNFYEN